MSGPLRPTTGTTQAAMAEAGMGAPSLVQLSTYVGVPGPKSAALYRAFALQAGPTGPLNCFDCWMAGRGSPDGPCDHPTDFRTWPPCEPRPDRPSLTGAR